MKRPAILFAISVVMLTNIAALALAAFNRSSADSTLTLTDRELPLNTWDPESTATTVRLQWLYPVADSTAAGWFGCDKLTAIGFDCSIDASDPRARTYYGHQSARNAFVVLEYNGRAWEAYEQEMVGRRARMTAQGAAATQEGFEREMATRPRLVAIDAGPDAAALRRAYPDPSMYLITTARVSITLRNTGGRDGHNFIQGNIQSVLPDTITVPPAHAGALRSIVNSWGPARSSSALPRYTITLTYGRLHEPWITALTPATKN